MILLKDYISKVTDKFEDLEVNFVENFYILEVVYKVFTSLVLLKPYKHTSKMIKTML